MQLKDTQVGDTVNVWVNSVQNMLMGPTDRGASAKLIAHILEPVGLQKTSMSLLGWRAGEAVPSNTYSYNEGVIPIGYVAAWYFNKDVECEIVFTSDMEMPSVSTVKQQEHPCKTCKRPNDMGVHKCWMCGVDNP